jgi:hypothetical protein
MPLPVYLKTSAEMPRPEDEAFYWLTQDGAFLCRNHPFFTSDVLTRRPVRALAAHAPRVEVRYPKVPAADLELIVGFFSRVYDLHRSESVVLLLWDLEGRRYRTWVPEQEATVYESWDGSRSPLDVRYVLRPALPPGHLLVGDVHCHGNMAAFASATDRADEVYRDGFHGIVGRINGEPPEFYLDLAVDGHRFALEMGQIFEGYRERDRNVPAEWLERVRVDVERAGRWWGWLEKDEAWGSPKKYGP